MLSVLRSFSPAMLIPARRSFCTIYGMQQVRERTAFTIGPNGLPGISHPTIDGATHWNLSEEALRELAAEGFVNTIALLEEASSRFQNDILRALTLYSARPWNRWPRASCSTSCLRSRPYCSRMMASRFKRRFPGDSPMWSAGTSKSVRRCGPALSLLTRPEAVSYTAVRVLTTT